MLRGVSILCNLPDGLFAEKTLTACDKPYFLNSAGNDPVTFYFAGV
jgi:hypothetical protein